MEASEKIAWLSIMTNLLLVGIKSAVALLSGSLAVTADAIHSMSDVVSSAIVLLGIKTSARRVRGFPYGLYKIENLVALLTSVLILFAGYEVVKTVFVEPARPLPRQLPLAIAGIGATIVITWLFSGYELKKGRETGSPSLIADAGHIRTDMLSSLVILFALVGSVIGFAIDRYAAIIVVVFITRSAISILLDSVRVLLDASLDHSSLQRIREIVLADPRVSDIKNLWARNAGRYKFVELDLILRTNELAKGHRLSEELENRIKLELAQVDRVLIHFQPREKNRLTLAIPLADDRRTISQHFGEAPFYRLLVLNRRKGEIIDDSFLENPYLEEAKGKGIKVAQWLLEKGLDMLICRHDQKGKGPGYVLGNGGAEIILTEVSDNEEALEEVLANMGKSASADGYPETLSIPGG